MKRLITVLLGALDPVPEALRHIPVNICNDGEYAVALIPFGLLGTVFGLKDNPYGIKVIHFLERNLLCLHLMPGRVGGLHPFLDLEIETYLLERLLDGFAELLHFLALFGNAAVDSVLYLLIGLRFLVAQPDILQFGLYAVKSEPVGEGNEYEHGLRKNLVPLVFRHVLDGAAVVEAVGKLDENNPHIVIHREEYALEIFGLEALLGDVGSAGFLLGVKHILYLGEAVYKGGNLVAEVLANVFHRIVRVFYDIVQEGGRDGFVSQSYIVNHYLGNRNGVNHIRFSTAPSHIPVGIVGELEGTSYHLQLFGGCTSLPGRFLEDCPIGLDYVIIFFCKLRKTHSLVMVFCILSLRLRSTSSFMWSISSVLTFCLSTFWKAKESSAP